MSQSDKNDILIDSAVFAQLTPVPNTQTQRNKDTCDIHCNRQHCLKCKLYTRWLQCDLPRLYIFFRRHFGTSSTQNTLQKDCVLWSAIFTARR